MRAARRPPYHSDPDPNQFKEMKMSTSDHHHSSFIDPVPTTSQVGQSSESSTPTLEGGMHIRRFRGPTVISEVANLPPNKQLNINWNKYGQPIGHNYNGFTRWLGILSRNGRLAPLDHDSWHHVPLSNKNEIWNEVKIKWNIDEERRNWVMKSIGASWKEWKKRLKKEHYNRYLTNEERLAHCPDRVEPTHWKWLVTYWSSDEGQARTQRNKINRSKHRMAHTAGSRSFAQVREEERAKNLSGESPDWATLFIATHRKKDGSVVNEESAHVIEMIEELRATQTAESSQSSTARDDLLSQILGPEHPGWVRMMGLGPTASTLWGTRNTIAQLRRETDELRRHMNERVEQLVEERMKEQMAKHLEQMEQRMTERIAE